MGQIVLLDDLTIEDYQMLLDECKKEKKGYKSFDDAYKEAINRAKVSKKTVSNAKDIQKEQHLQGGHIWD